MPAICEVCGREDESAADNMLQLCAGCMNDRQPAEAPGAGSEEDAAD